MPFSLIKKRLLFSVLVAALFMTSGLALAEGVATIVDPAIVNFRNAVDTILSQSCPNGLRAGAKFYSLDRQQVIYSRNSDSLFTPASNMKMFTSAMALKKVGPDYRFHTRLYAVGRIEGTVLKGDLYIKGFGDPSLVTEQMWILVNELKN